MAKQKAFADLGEVDLVEQLSHTKQELFNLRFQHATGRLDNSTRLSHTKKEIARLLTEIRAREIAAATVQTVATDSEALR